MLSAIFPRRKAGRLLRGANVGGGLRAEVKRQAWDWPRLEPTRSPDRGSSRALLREWRAERLRRFLETDAAIEPQTETEPRATSQRAARRPKSLSACKARLPQGGESRCALFPMQRQSRAPRMPPQPRAAAPQGFPASSQDWPEPRGCAGRCLGRQDHSCIDSRAMPILTGLQRIDSRCLQRVDCGNGNSS